MALTLCYTDRASTFLAAAIYTFILLHSCDGSLTVKPINIEAEVGQRVQLSCSTSEPYYVLWDHASVGSTTRNYVYFSGVLVLPYSHRFQLVRDADMGVYNLVIPSVQKEDAGNYRCMDMVGHGEQAEAELIVLDSKPQCQTDVVRFCERTSQNFGTSCTVGFTGNIIPVIECRINDVTTTNSVVNGQTENSVTYNQQLTAHWPLDVGHGIVCRTSLSHVSSTVKPTVMYAFESTHPLTMDHPYTVPVSCKANSSEQCSYEWINKDTSAVVSTNQTLLPGEPGHYTCKAACKLRDTICSVTPLVVNLVTQEATSEVDRINVPIVVCLCVAAVGTCLIFAVGALVIVRRRTKTRRKKSGHRNLEGLGMAPVLSSNVAISTQETSSDHKRTNGHVLTCKNSHTNINGNTNCISETLLEDTLGHVRIR